MYFYRVVLKAKQFARSPEALTLGEGGITIDLTDEGIVTAGMNIDDLLR